MQPVARCVLCSVRHTRHNLVGQRKIVVHKYKQVLRCDVLIVIADNNDAYSHSNLYYVWKKRFMFWIRFGVKWDTRWEKWNTTMQGDMGYIAVIRYNTDKAIP